MVTYYLLNNNNGNDFFKTFFKISINFQEFFLCMYIYIHTEKKSSHNVAGSPINFNYNDKNIVPLPLLSLSLADFSFSLLAFSHSLFRLLSRYTYKNSAVQIYMVHNFKVANDTRETSRIAATRQPINIRIEA